VVRDGREIFLVPPNDAGGLAEGIRRTSSSENRSAAREALLRAEWTCAGFAKRLAAILNDGKFL
jgi:hypothetical protein